LTAAFDWRTPDYGPVYQERVRRLAAIENPEVLAAHLVHYKNAPEDFISDWLFTYDPRRVGMGGDAFIPFYLFPRQRELIQWLLGVYRTREDGVVEKSREVGVSWLCCAFALWAWLFEPGAKIGFGSRKLDFVDKLGDPRTLLEKIRVMTRRLPPVFLPPNFIEKKHSSFLRIINPETGATVSGEGGDDIGRGDKATIYFIDEAAFLDHPEKVDAALTETSDCKIHISTPNGVGNPFYRKVHGGHYPVFRFHWREDPRKDAAWYAERQRKLDPITLAQEIDLDYAASVENAVVSSLHIDSSIALNKHLQLQPTGRGIAGLDVGGGRSKSVFCARFGPLVLPLTSWSEGDTTHTAYRAIEEVKRTTVRLLNYDSIGVGAGVTSVFHRANLEVAADLEELGNPEPPLDFTDPIAVVNAAARAQRPPGPRPGAKVYKVEVQGINAGSPASKWTMWPDGASSAEKFSNLKAECWWLIRDRLLKAHELWLWIQGDDGGKEHPVEETLLLPDDTVLRTQLAQPTYKLTTGGKISIESKTELARRGVPSPDYAEALTLTMVPTPPRTESYTLKGLF
jgi:phage terminase large subunit